MKLLDVIKLWELIFLDDILDDTEGSHRIADFWIYIVIKTEIQTLYSYKV